MKVIGRGVWNSSKPPGNTGLNNFYGVDGRRTLKSNTPQQASMGINFGAAGSQSSPEE